ncbi:MAG: HDIG domain-containing protein [Oligosphaeraceae bacterium]|nr:HDIG domain-containing protein [Oligosphaeraceae bacterium]
MPYGKPESAQKKAIKASEKAAAAKTELLDSMLRSRQKEAVPQVKTGFFYSLRSFLLQHWPQLLAFFLVWIVGAFLLCSHLQKPVQLRMLEQFAKFTLRAEFPFTCVDTKALTELEKQTKCSTPPVLVLKEGSYRSSRAAFEARIKTLLESEPEQLQNEAETTLYKLFLNTRTTNIFFACLLDVINSGIVADDWQEQPTLRRYRPESHDEVWLIVDDRPYKRDVTSLLTPQSAAEKLQNNFREQIGNHTVDLSFFQVAELLPVNLEFNPDEFEHLQRQKLREAEMPLLHFKTGDPVLKVSKQNEEALQAYLQKGRKNFRSGLQALRLEINRDILLRLILQTLFIAIFIFTLNRIHIAPASLEQRLSVSAVALILHFLLSFGAFYIYGTHNWSFAYLLCLMPLALVPALLANLLGGRVAVCAAVTIAALLPLQISQCKLQYQLFCYAAFIGLVGVAFFRRAKKRRDFLVGGAAVAVAIMLSQIFFAIDQDILFGQFRVDFLKILLFSAANGLLISLLCMALLPLFEVCFGLVTLSTLLELNDSNHPLLLRLSKEAPGTFQHSMNVATIAEAAANAIQANALLARVMALFHDIGKLENPSFFAENQRDEPNPHDSLPAEESFKAISAHISDGLALAQKYRLRRPIRAAIEQHHGNSLLSCFFEKAKKEAAANGESAPDESSFRYPHPPPLQKEIVIVSLADACEAAVRALSGNHRERNRFFRQAAELLEDSEHLESGEQQKRLKEFLQRLEQEKNMALTNEGIANQIIKIIDEKWDDKQFAEADITTSELEAIEQSFLRTFMDMYHFRPRYRRNEPEPETKAAHEDQARV